MTNMANLPNMLNMVNYLHNVMYMGVATSSTTMTNFFGGTCAFSLLGGFLSDSYITRFKTILIFGPFQVLVSKILRLVFCSYNQSLKWSCLDSFLMARGMDYWRCRRISHRLDLPSVTHTLKEAIASDFMA